MNFLLIFKRKVNFKNHNKTSKKEILSQNSLLTAQDKSFQKYYQVNFFRDLYLNLLDQSQSSTFYHLKSIGGTKSKKVFQSKLGFKRLQVGIYRTSRLKIN